MRHGGLEGFLRQGRATLSRGPLALILAEDAVEVASTLHHHLSAGFRTVLLLAHPDMPLAPDAEAQVHRIDHDVFAEGALAMAANRLIRAAPGQWIYAGYNAEYLFHPFAETRSVVEMLAFHTEERRDALSSAVIDLYAADLQRTPGAVCRQTAMLDRLGYYALDRPDPDRPGQVLDRQRDLYGGLRWRFEQHIPPDRRRIDRIALFRALPGLRMRPDFTFNLAEHNTWRCPWHRNLTTAVCSFRTAKALKANPASTFAIPGFRWHNSVAFQWRAQQLMELGMMEPGQWF
jgi:hypothetical protein